ncbi:MAG: DUF1214 domain-containing protein [Acidimicrobiales bacterium]|nr:DUF1214 domain-containing protein [Acidimicrobiales bacterium]
MEPNHDSSLALRELAELLTSIDDDVSDARWPFVDEQDRVSYRQFAMHALHHGLQFWLEADPVRPWFHRWFSPSKKLLGDNPDTVYYGTVIDPTRTYRIRGNTANACYTSFTVESGTAGAKMSQKLGHTLNDSEFDVDAAGNYELVASPEDHGRNWLRLDPDAGSITTRHYFEWQRCAALDPTLHIPLVIEPIEDPGPPPVPDDAAAAAGIRRVQTFLRSVTLDWGHTAPPPGVIPWVSARPNEFTNPADHDGNLAIGYAATDNVYRSTRWQLAPDEALVIRGRFPRCRFANVVLFNHHMQTPNHDRRAVSLNRVQTVCEPDGSFRMVVAHRDPGTPNWLDTRGLGCGTVFWRFLLPEEPLEPLETEVIRLG